MYWQGTQAKMRYHCFVPGRLQLLHLRHLERQERRVEFQHQVVLMIELRRNPMAMEEYPTIRKRMCTFNTLDALAENWCNTKICQDIVPILLNNNNYSHAQEWFTNFCFTVVTPTSKFFYRFNTLIHEVSIKWGRGGWEKFTGNTMSAKSNGNIMVQVYQQCEINIIP